jgi:hypothetical protein
MFWDSNQLTVYTTWRFEGRVGASGCDKLVRMEDRDIDALFRLPLSEFTSARNALAARLKKTGRGQEAERVKALGKPPVSAWAVNQLYWKHRDAFDRLDDAGARFRQAQAAQLAGRTVDVQGPREARRKALAELTRLAATVLGDGGHNPASDTLRRITTTLEAISAYAELPESPRAGRLTQDVEPPGFDALAALMPASLESRPRAPAISDKAKAAAEAALHKAQQTLEEARARAEAANGALKTAAALTREAEKNERRLAAEARAAEAAVEAATQAVESAGRKAAAL